MTVIYPPEPLVAEAACRFLEFKDGSNVSDFLEQLHSFWSLCLNGLVSAGEVGAFLARFCISFAYDRAIIDKRTQIDVEDSFVETMYSVPIPLQNFLQKLLPGDELELLKISERFAEAEVCFTNWVHLEALEPNEPGFDDYIEECFTARTAVILPQAHIGADLVVPFRYKSKNDQGGYSYVYS